MPHSCLPAASLGELPLVHSFSVPARTGTLRVQAKTSQALQLNTTPKQSLISQHGTWAPNPLQLPLADQDLSLWVPLRCTRDARYYIQPHILHDSRPALKPNSTRKVAQERTVH